MIISDLNYLETVEEANVVGGITNKVAKQELVFKEIVDIEKKVVSRPDIKGNLAFAEVDSNAFGKNTLTQSLIETYSEEGVASSSVATGVSGSLN